MASAYMKIPFYIGCHMFIMFNWSFLSNGLSIIFATYTFTSVICMSFLNYQQGGGISLKGRDTPAPRLISTRELEYYANLFPLTALVFGRQEFLIRLLFWL